MCLIPCLCDGMWLSDRHIHAHAHPYTHKHTHRQCLFRIKPYCLISSQKRLKCNCLPITDTHTHTYARTHAQTHRLEAQMVKWGFVCVCLCVSGVLGMIKCKTFHLSLCLSSRSTGSRPLRPGGSRGNLWWFTLVEFLEVLTVITECPGTPRVGLRHAPTLPVCLSPAYWWFLLPVLALNLVWQWGHIFVLCHVVLLIRWI